MKSVGTHIQLELLTSANASNQTDFDEGKSGVENVFIFFIFINSI